MLLSLLVLTVSTSAPTPLMVVKNADAEVQKILQSPEPTVDKLAARADEVVDFLELARRALGKEWDKLTKKQQEDFSKTMKELLRANYAQKAISDGRGGAKVEYGEEKIDGDQATVETTILVSNDKVPVIYRLWRADPKGTWRIYDVVTDDVSLVSTYADQFRQVISKKGFDGLLASLKAKRDQLEKTASSRPQ